MNPLRRRTLLERTVAVVAVEMARVPFISAACALVDACATGRTVRFTGVDASTGANVVLVSGALPAGVSGFDGEYRSPQLGQVSLVQRGDDVFGDYRVRREDLELEGTLVGRAEGNLVQVRFIEQARDGSARAEGHGYFLLDRPRPDVRIRLFGMRACEVWVPAAYARSASRTRSESTPWSAVRVGVLTR